MKQKQESKRMEDQILERFAFEKNESQRRLNQIITEKDTYINNLAEDNGFLQQ